MRRTINAFSLSSQAADELDWLVKEVHKKGPSPALIPFLETTQLKPLAKGEEAKPEALDEYSLKQSDYQTLYDSLPQPKPYRIGIHRLYPPAPQPAHFTWPLLVDLSRRMERDAEKRAQLFAGVKQTQIENRRELRRHETVTKRRAKKGSADVAPAPFVVNRSRVVEAIILLVVSGQKERVLQVVADTQGSSPKNARKGGDKLSKSSRRKAITV